MTSPGARELVPREFFDRPSTVVAPLLLGCVLVHEVPEGTVAVELTEVEAYTGSTDPASHAFRGKTARNAVMFGGPGYAYVYFTYGMHFCVNLVCQPAGEASAVLLRAGRVVEGEDLAAMRRAGRSGPKPDAKGAGLGTAAVRPATLARGAAQLASGPARLCQALAIDRAQNGADVCAPGGALRICAGSDSAGLPPERISAGPRVGVSTGAETPWRFWIAGDQSVSPYRAHVPKRRAGATP